MFGVDKAIKGFTGQTPLYGPSCHFLLEELLATPASYEGVNSNNNCLGLVEKLIAYLQIVDVTSILDLVVSG